MKSKKNQLPAEKQHKRLIKAQVKTNPNYGKKPSERTIKELLNSGIINLDKPKGPTSHQVDAWLKKIFDIKKVGHAGTLDPNATGVLPVGIGDATKALQILLEAGKEYVGIMHLHQDVDLKKVLTTSKNFVGEISQLPPVRSSVKRQKRKRKIYYFDILQKKGRDVLFKVGCESGTYVRTICNDFGKQIGKGAHLSELRRTKVGHITENDSVILQDVKDGYIFWKEDKDESFLKSMLNPVETVVRCVPRIILRDSAVDAICHGANLAVPGVAELDSNIKKRDTIAAMTLKGELVAILESLMSTETIIQKDTGICGKLKRVIMKKGTYPSVWKKS